MRKLLRADLTRLFKSGVFRILLLVMLVAAVNTVLGNYDDLTEYGIDAPIDKLLGLYTLFAGGGCAILTGLFIGVDFGDGTIKNKLIVGHTRPAVYLSALIASITAAFTLALAYLAAYIPLGLLLLEAPTNSLKTIITTNLLSVLTLCAFAALFTLISMSVSRKAAAAVLCILLFIALLMSAVIIKERLDAPETISDYSLTINGGFEQNEPRPNPMYLQPDERAVYELLFDLLPTGQAVGITLYRVHSVRIIICTLVLSAVTTLAGIVIFSKKDIR